MKPRVVKVTYCGRRPRPQQVNVQHPFQGADVSYCALFKAQARRLLRPELQGVGVIAASLQQREGPSPPDGKLGFDL